MFGGSVSFGSLLFNRVFDSVLIREDLLSQDTARQLSSLQQVLACMMMGKDMSGHFSDITPLCSSTDLTIKRLVYLYLMHNCRAQPQKAVLQAGTFVKDTLSDSPLIRGAALRTMTSLLVPVMVDFILPPLQRCLEDGDPYVRRIAAFGALKLYYIAPKAFEDAGMLDELKKLLYDENALVIAAVVAVILEVFRINKQVVIEFFLFENLPHLLKVVGRATGWYQHYLLEGIAAAIKGSDSVLSAANAVEILDSVLPVLSSFNVATVISAVKVITLVSLRTSSILTSLANREAINDGQQRLLLQECYGPRVVEVCVSLLYEPSLEMRYAVLRNVHLLLTTDLHSLFKSYLGTFFVKHDDPICIKLEKIRLLFELADAEVGGRILSEYVVYVTDRDAELVQKVVHLIGLLAVKVESLAKQCVEKLIALIDTGIGGIIEAAAVVLRTVFQCYPNYVSSIVTRLFNSFSHLSTTEARISVVWMLGEYTEHLNNLEEVIDLCVESFTTQPYIVQLVLITAVVKIYLRADSLTAKHITSCLWKLLSLATESPIPDVRDRAFMYWRLVSKDRDVARELIFASAINTASRDPGSVERPRLQGLLTDIGNITSVLHLPLHLIYGRGAALNDNDDGDMGEEEEEEKEENWGREKKKKVSDEGENDCKLLRPVACALLLDEKVVDKSTASAESTAHAKESGVMCVALSANEGSGLEIRMGWSQLGNKLLLNCSFALLPGEDYTRHVVVRAFQMNRNIFALGFAQECPPVRLELGHRELEMVHLLTGTNNEKSATRDLFFAVNAEPIGTRYFLAPPVPPAMLLLPARGLDAGLFARLYQELQAPSWTMPAMLTPVRTNHACYTGNALRLHCINLVHSGMLSDSGIVRLFLSAETIAKQKIFFEVAIQNDYVVYLSVRCKDALISPVFGAYTLRVLSVTSHITARKTTTKLKDI